MGCGDPSQGRPVTNAVRALSTGFGDRARDRNPLGRDRFGEGSPLRGGTRNPSTDASHAYGSETKIIAKNSTYGTRQSNKGSGGAAIYGCRAATDGKACLSGYNLKSGDSFQFETKGSRGGKITVGDTSGAPLTTNAKGVATNFNADQVDGKDARAFASAGDLKFAVVSAAATITSGRGATSAGVVGTTYTVTFDANVSRCSYTATPEVNAANTLAVASGTDPTTVVVTQSAGPSGFHLQVIC